PYTASPLRVRPRSGEQQQGEDRQPDQGPDQSPAAAIFEAAGRKEPGDGAIAGAGGGCRRGRGRRVNLGGEGGHGNSPFPAGDQPDPPPWTGGRQSAIVYPVRFRGSSSPIENFSPYERLHRLHRRADQGPAPGPRPDTGGPGRPL